MSESVEAFERKEFEEKLAKMSPEELREFQKQQCIFCKIITGSQASKTVYEDETCIVVLDIFPATPGHVLIIPKEHYMVMPQIPKKSLQHLFMVAKAFSHACLRVLNAGGSTIFVANGAAAGQKAPHFMIHVIPRQEHDNLGLNPTAITLRQEDEQRILQLLPKIIQAVIQAQKPDTAPQTKEQLDEADNEQPVIIPKKIPLEQNSKKGLDEIANLLLRT
ncbi:MAG: HIT domain-containing protein [Nanoarchaeota archaeon]